MTLPVVFTANGPSGYNLTKSLRFRSSASAYLNRTFASAGNQRTWTWSAWVKRGALSAVQNLFGVIDLSVTNRQNYLTFQADNTLAFYNYTTSGYNYQLITTQVFRDASAWYHIVCVSDTTQATSSNRLKLYVNGTQITAFSTASYPSQNFDGWVNSNPGSGVQLGIGRVVPYNTSEYFDGYLAEINFIDGQALTPSSFGETSTTTGVWIPKKYTGSYGTNGFYLPFTDTTSTSTLGTDFSGNSNTWTVNNISLTSGSTYDSMTDVPTLTSATTANYCVMNPLDNYATTITNGNLQLTGSSSAWNTTRSTFAMPSGSWYCELTATSGTGNGNSFVGIAPQSTPLSSISNSTFVGGTSTSWAYSSNGNTYTNGGILSATGTTWASGSVIGISFTGSELKFYKNNTLVTTISSIPTNSYCITTSFYSSDAGAINFGQRPFAYTPPTGFVALNTFNLPTPTIGATASSQANKYFDATLFTGTGANATITNSGSMQPDFVWGKSRSNAFNHILMDSVRGTGVTLFSNSTSADYAVTDAVTSFNSNGFSYGVDPTCNTNGSTNVFWQWRASNATAVSNTAGSITSTVSANTTAGFSIATYTGNGSNSTVGHGLGVAPSMVIVKQRNTAQSWCVWHTSIGSANVLFLNSTSASTSYPTLFNSMSTLNSTVFSIGTDIGTNQNTGTYVAYCFAPIAGYSAFGSYTGNGSSDGPFIFTGFRPRYVLIKTSSAGTNGWQIRDTSRSPYNTSLQLLYADTSNAEISSAGNDFDILSNGFKVRNSGGDLNTNGGTYIYACFAENPFKYANAR